MLFNVSGGDCYDGMVTVRFKNGKLASVEANSRTDDEMWVGFIIGLVEGMESLYPDGGVDGLSDLAEQFFMPDARNCFWRALSMSGISSDRDAIRYCKDKKTLISLVSMLDNLIKWQNT